jgi:heat-inducible transcriptional repressor
MVIKTYCKLYNNRGDVMISSRQEKLLKLIVEDYIKTAKPVSSKSLTDQLDCSSATIRAEMNLLEEYELLEKEHISSGRIPSEKGYRYYVDHIMKPKELNGEDMLKLQTIISNKSLVISDAIAKSMEIISELTNYTAIVLGKHSKDNLVNKIEVVPIDRNNLIAIVITDKGHIEHSNIHIDEEVSVDDIKQTVDLINKLIVGVPIDDVSSVLEFQVKPIIGNYVKQHEVLYNAFYNAFNDFTTNEVHMSGTKNMLMQPEFNNVDKIRDIVSKFEDKDIVGSITEEGNGVNIYIGSETNFDDDVTIIKTRYKVNGEEGTIALIGPKRMEYDRVIPLLNYIKENINDDKE